MSKHNITHATDLFFGGANFPPISASNGRVGAPFNPITQLSLGSPIAADPNGLVDAATSTELPNTETVTYTTANDGTTPFDNADTPVVTTITTSTGASASVWPIAVPRNMSLNVTHGSSIVAMSCTITGYDVYGVKVQETLSVTATGTTKTTAGKKAFAYIESIAFTAAADAEANTANLGWGDVLGLPYYATAKADVMQVWFNDALDTSVTTVAGDTTTATATTGDVRGTVDPNSACDGSAVKVWMRVNPETKATLAGIDQFGG